MQKAIGERIRQIRLAKGLSQENMAAELDLSVSAYSNIERGVTDVSISRLAKISAVLKIDVTELVEHSKEQKASSSRPSFSVQRTSDFRQDAILNRLNVIEHELELHKSEIGYLRDMMQIIVKGKTVAKKK